MKVNNYIILDFNKTKQVDVQTIHCDMNSRFVRVNLRHNNSPIDLSDVRVCIMAVKPDGKEIFNDCTVIDAQNGLAEFEITKQMGIVVGEVKCQIKLFGKEKLLSSNIFNLSVSKSLSPNSRDSKDQLNTLVESLNRVDEWDDQFQQKYNGLEEEYAHDITEIKGLMAITPTAHDFIDERIIIENDIVDRVNGVEQEIVKTNAQLSKNKNELSDKIQEVASTGTTTEVLQSTTENYIQQKIDDGTIANMTIEDATVSPRKTTFIVSGLNLFNKDDFKRGDIGPFDGIFQSNPLSNNMASQFIKVKEGDILYFRDVTKNPSNVMGRMFKYDESKNFIAYYTPDYNSFKYEIDFDGYLRFHINVNTFNDNAAKISISLNEDIDADTYKPYEEQLDEKIKVKKASECDFAKKSETAKSCEIANQAVNAQKAIESETSNYSNYSGSSNSSKLLEKSRVVNFFDVDNATHTGPTYEKQENGIYLFQNINSTPIFWFIKNIQPLFEIGDKWYAVIHGRVVDGDSSSIQVNIQRLDGSGADYIELSEDGTFKGYISGSITSNTDANLFGGFRVKEIPTDGSCTIELYNFCYLSSKVELNEKQIEYFYNNQLKFKEEKPITYEATELIKEVVEELIPPYFNGYATKTDVTQMINNKLSEKNTWYAGKKLSIFGDSITECSGSFTLANGVEGSEWSILLNKHFGFGEVVNCGLGGSTVVDLAPSCMSNDKRINAIPEDSDVITFMGGTNDWLQNQPIGTLEGSDGYYNGLKTVAEKLIKRFPTAKIFWMTPTYGLIGDGTGQNYTEISSSAQINLYEYVKAMRETAKRYGFPLIDLYGSCGWNEFNAKIYLNDEKNLLHPNKNGGKRIASVIIGEFEKYEPY